MKRKPAQPDMFPPPTVGLLPVPVLVNFDDGQGWQKVPYSRAFHILSLYYKAADIPQLLAKGQPIPIAIQGRSVYFARPLPGTDLPETFWHLSCPAGESTARPQRSEDGRSATRRGHARRAA